MQPPAAELTADDARLLDPAGFTQSHSDVWTAGAETTSRIDHLVGTALTADEVANGLGIAAVHVHQRRLARRLWGITDGQSWLFPAPPFEISDDGRQLRVIRGMDRVLRALPEGLHPVAIEGFLDTPQPDLSTDRPMTPLEWLRGGGDTITVVTVASAARYS
ncbi:Uncharacterised protein [Mycobacteroides abscessus]|uniref:hypothetical protein n=1 Tax=Mycobacteroides abscessus TaxID=36809 RepID=UPI0005E468F2|nr:hypothetical protein [Mycobacteroides abscessus]CPU62639.1 Uncharacterised protein [Mycobacteroides abscessus]CPX67783.1 Uncharacterised protein [Mycobacteroides abscessus]CPZ70052.1 Uncharacterised protein [Mycobacteroides abscessus]